MGDAILKPLISSIFRCGQSYGGVMDKLSLFRLVYVCAAVLLLSKPINKTLSLIEIKH